MGKKSGDGIGNSTTVNRATPENRTDLRTQRVMKVLKMYRSRIKRDPRTNKIVSGSVLSASDRVERTMARVAPDRRWFGNTRVIGTNALQTFREEMKSKQNDPYSILLKQNKLPYSLLDEKADDKTIHTQMRYEETFGKKALRKRVKLHPGELSDLFSTAVTKSVAYGTGDKDTRKHQLEDAMTPQDARGVKRKLFEKGQSARIWNELFKVIDSSDVILYVLDARDPLGTRSRFIEEYIRKEKRYKHFVFVLNKCDLVPAWAVSRWLQILSKDHPTIAMHSSTTNPFGKGNLINILRQFSRLHNISERPKKTKTGRNPISVGLIGYPNVGKSSVINTLRRKKVCKVAPIPGETKVWQYVMLTRSIYLIDCPGVVYDREGNNDVEAVLKGVVRVERMGDIGKEDMIDTILQIVKPKDIRAKYGVEKWANVDDFLRRAALERGKVLPGGHSDTDAIAKMVLYDWQRGAIPWFNAPPFESNQKVRDAQQLPEAEHMKFIENYSSFNIVDDQIVQSMRTEEDNKKKNGDSSKQRSKRSREDSPTETTDRNVRAPPKGGVPSAEAEAKDSKKKNGDSSKQRSKRSREDSPTETTGRNVRAPPNKDDVDEDALWDAVLKS